jgi:hypothetical protein
MSDRDLEYAHPGDDLSRTTTATLTSGTQATGYEPVRLTNDDPSYPFKVDTTTFRLLWDFGTPRPIAYVLLVHHNFMPGLTGVTFALGSTSATTDYTQTFTIRAYGEDRFPTNEHLDLRADGPPVYRYASLSVTTANTVPCAIGKVPILTTVRALDGALLLEPDDDESHPLVEHQSDLGVSTIFSFGTRRRWLRGDKIQEASDAAAIRAWNRATYGRGLPFVLIPHVFPDGDPSGEEAWICRWEDENLPRTYMDMSLRSRFRLKFEEVSRGLRPTPAAI